MTRQEILKAIEDIKKVADDDEVAHGKDDDLREAFIEYVSKRTDSLGEKAKLILSTNDIDFVRWYA